MVALSCIIVNDMWLLLVVVSHVLAMLRLYSESLNLANMWLTACGIRCSKQRAEERNRRIGLTVEDVTSKGEDKCEFSEGSGMP